MVEKTTVYMMDAGVLNGDTRISEFHGLFYITQSGNSVMFDGSKLDELIETLTIIKQETSQ